MNVPTHNIQGLLIYRELCEKEGRSVGRWRERFGAEALLKDMEARARDAYRAAAAPQPKSRIRRSQTQHHSPSHAW